MADNQESTNLPPDLPRLPNGWNWKPLISYVPVGRGISYGIVQPGDHDVNGVPTLRAENVQNSRVELTNVMRVSRSIEEKYKRTRLKGGEILITLVGAYFGKVAVAPKEVEGYNTARAVGVVPVESDATFLCHALQSPVCQRYIQNWATTTAQPTLNLRDLAKIPIPSPPPQTRRAIGKLLGTLVDKIELNRRMNGTLKAIARALFQSWFVDFGAVRAKVAGRDPLCPRSFADLFPEAFEDSKFGEIPRGWRYVPLGDKEIFPLVCPGVVADESTRLRYIATGDVQGDLIAHEIENEFGNLPSRANMQPGKGRVFFAKMKDSPKFLWTMSEDEPWWSSRVLSTGFSGIQACKRSYESLLYCFVSSQDFDDTKNQLATGTTMQALNNETIGTVVLMLPNSSVAEQFDKQVRPLYRRIWKNFFESRVLGTLRDLLLPKLLSGEIPVSTEIV